VSVGVGITNESVGVGTTNESIGVGTTNMSVGVGTTNESVGAGTTNVSVHMHKWVGTKVLAGHCLHYRAFFGTTLCTRQYTHVDPPLFTSSHICWRCLC